MTDTGWAFVFKVDPKQAAQEAELESKREEDMRLSTNLQLLQGMGFTQDEAETALLKFGNKNLFSAAGWLFQNIDIPFQSQSSSGASDKSSGKLQIGGAAPFSKLK